MSQQASSQGRVAVVHGRMAMVRDAGGQQRLCQIKGRGLKPVCGDVVEVDDQDHIIALRGRRNEFPRVDARGKRRIVAANLDRVFVVVAPQPAPSPYLVDRYLLACHAVGIEAAVVLNKLDLIEGQTTIRNVDSALYERLGYPVLALKARQGQGLSDLADQLGGGTGVLVGQSGVGKSTIVNGLVPDLAAQTRALSSATGKGRHTTTASTLYQMPGGGRLIDSPGVWEFGVWHLSPAEIERGFIDFSGYRDRCRFSNCRHLGEPGCAVAEAVRRDELSDARLRAYRDIIRTNDRQASGR